MIYNINNIEYIIEKKKRHKRLIFWVEITLPLAQEDKKYISKIIVRRLKNPHTRFNDELEGIINKHLAKGFMLSQINFSYEEVMQIRIELWDNREDYLVIPEKVIEEVAAIICEFVYIRHIEPIVDFITIHKAYEDLKCGRQ